MTSRALRIVLPLYGHRAYTPAVPKEREDLFRCVRVARLTGDWCAVDEIGPLERAAIATPLAPRVLVGGNYGLPCA